MTKRRKDWIPAFAGMTMGGRFYFLLLILITILLLPHTAAAENLTCSRLPELMEDFQAKHYAMQSMTEEIQTHAVDQMIKHLDPTRTLLYESDLSSLRPLLQVLFTSTQEGDCSSLQPVYNLLVTRARENEAIVKKILGPKFRLDKTVELNIDVNKRPYPKTVKEKQDLLKKIVQFQMENALLAGLDMGAAKKQQIHRYELQTKRVAEQDPAHLITSFAEAFALALDPHTSYLTPQNLEDLRISMQLSLEGIGALLGSDTGFTIIEELIPGGGADRSGMLKPKDKIIAVAQEGEKPVNVIDMDLRDVISMIRGKKGTRVTLTILRQGKHTERFDVTIVRDKIDVTQQEAKITYQTRIAGSRVYRFGIIDLPSFYGGEKGGRSSYEDVKNLLAEARQQHVDGIVLNLSRNGGGLLADAVRLAGLFIGEGGIVATKDSRGRVTILANGSTAAKADDKNRKFINFPAEDPQALYMGPLVVLTSRLSASASEIVAGALKDYHRAVIVGSDHTFGKGSVQAVMPLPSELGAIKVTRELYFLPGGQSTQKAGVAADVVLPGWFSLEDIGEAELDYPLPAQAIAPFLNLQKTTPLWTPVDQRLIAALAARSHARVAKDAKFLEILKNNKEAAAKKGIIRLADLVKEIKKEGGSKEKETFSEQRQKVLDQYAPFLNESVNVLFDMAAPGSAARE
ncbi:MAG TPA: S41 family peptidase [Syntrophales bacterium]|nr:S41 family peptidase [Syntrophales bacterium]